MFDDQGMMRRRITAQCGRSRPCCMPLSKNEMIGWCISILSLALFRTACLMIMAWCGLFRIIAQCAKIKTLLHAIDLWLAEEMPCCCVCRMADSCDYVIYTLFVKLEWLLAWLLVLTPHVPGVRHEWRAFPYHRNSSVLTMRKFLGLSHPGNLNIYSL